LAVSGKVPRAKNRGKKLCRISAALREGSNGDNDFVGFLVVRNEHHRRDASLFSIAVQFPKLDVAGSIPVSRSWFQETVRARKFIENLVLRPGEIT
jgi:hypothetical protein